MTIDLKFNSSNSLTYPSGSGNDPDIKTKQADSKMNAAGLVSGSAAGNSAAAIEKVTKPVLHASANQKTKEQAAAAQKAKEQADNNPYRARAFRF